MTQDDLELRLDEAEQALSVEDPETALDLCDAILRQMPGQLDALMIMGYAFSRLGDLARAEDNFRAATQQHSDVSETWSALSLILWHQLRLDEALAATHRALRYDASNPQAALVRGLIRERKGDDAGARRDFLRAWRDDPTLCPLPVPLSDDMVEDVVTEAQDALQGHLSEALSQVAILLEELPTDEVCLSFDPPARSDELLGLFQGPSLADRQLDDPWSTMPATITLYRKNLERMAHDRDHLIDEVRITLLHEIGHYLGLDEDEVAQRGLA